MTRRTRPKAANLPTTLPATALEAEALAFARAWIADCLKRDDPMLNMIDAGQQGRGRAVLRAEMKRAALQHPNLMMDIVYFARHGFEDATAALDEIMAERHDRFEPLGAVLGEYAIPLRHPRLSRRGPAKQTNFFQNLIIYIITEKVVLKFGLKPTRSTLARRHPSACSIVTQVVNEARLGRQFTEKAVEAIWWKYLPIDTGKTAAGRGLLD